MRPYQRLLSSFVLFIAAWFSLFHAAIQLPPNSKDLSDTSGLSIVLLLTIALLTIGIPAIVFSSAGILISIFTKSKSFSARLLIFSISNFPLLLASLLGILVIGLFVIETLNSIIGVILFAGVMGLIMSAAPKRVADKNQK
ncbi:hypothetical protein [Pseudomonas sp. CLCA07]